MYSPIDIEDVCQAWLNDHGITAGAVPVSAELSAPYVAVRALGGSRESVIDRFTVSFSCYGERWKAANDLAREAIDALAQIPYGDSGATVYTVEVSTLPYADPDPDAADKPRVSFTLLIAARINDR